MSIRDGDSGALVASVQRFLIQEGVLQEGQDDGVWGPLSAGALLSWQREYRPLVADGIPGPITFAAIRSSGWDLSLQLAPLVRSTAIRLGIRPELLEAFRIVESGATADPSAMRFEPHVFLRHVPDADIPYTPSSRGAWSLTASETGASAFQRAFSIHGEAAVRSTSWGLFQVLGAHLLKAYPDRSGEACAETAIREFEQNPEAASYMLVEAWFHASPRALAAAQADPPDLRKLVRYYNGPGQVDRYSGKLAEALRRVEAGSLS